MINSIGSFCYFKSEDLKEEGVRALYTFGNPDGKPLPGYLGIVGKYKTQGDFVLGTNGPKIGARLVVESRTITWKNVGYKAEATLGVRLKLKMPKIWVK